MINLKQIKIALIVLGIIILIFAGFAVFNSYKEGQIKEEVRKRVEAEMKLEQYKNEFAERKIEIDSLDAELKKSLAVIEYQKKYPQIIIKKYETKADSISKLLPNEQYNLFTNNLRKYASDRKRYSVSRFK